ncbi:MAG TPA: DUF748 domain-containing protein, partial [Tepidisphaeraceae bacterium]|nr:DUF748 domain-containing protein [Tepidisphaeraceae bacterium]
MSDTTTSPTETSEPASKPKRSGKLRRRVLKTLLVVVTLFVVVRVAMFFLVGFVVRNVAHLYGLDVTFGHQQLTLFAGDAGLWDVTVKATDSDHELLRADYVRGKISTFALLSGRLHASRVEADGVSISLQREADGRVPALEDVLRVLAKLESGKKNAPPAAPDFTAPLSIDALRLQHVQISLRDALTSPVFQTVLYADLRVSGLQRSDKDAASVEADIWAENVLDVLRVRGELSGFGRKLSTHLTFEGRGLNLAHAAGYFTPFGLSPVEFDELRGLDFNAKLSLDTSAANTPTGLIGTIKVNDVSAADADGLAIGLRKLQLDIALLDIGKLHFGKLAIEGGRVNARRTDDGNVRFAGIEFGARTKAIKQTVRATSGLHPTTKATSPTTRPAVELILPSVELRDMLARFQDDAVDPMTAIEVHLMQLDGAVKMVDNHPTTFDFTGKVESPRLAKSLDLSGSILPFKSPFSASINYNATGVTLEGLRGYLAPLGIEPTFKDGTAAGIADLVLRLDETGASFDVELAKLLVQDGAQKLQLPEVSIHQLAISPDASRVFVDDVTLVGPELTIRHEPDGALSLIGFRISPKKLLTTLTSSDATTQPTTTTTSPTSNPRATLPRIELGAFSWKGVRVRLEDGSTGSERVFNLTDAGVELRDLLIDMNSKESSTKPGKLKAWLTLPDVAGRIDVDGTFTPSPNAIDAQFNVEGRELNLVTLSPYLEKSGVTPTMSSGSLAAKLKLRVASSENALSADFNLTDASIRDGQMELGGVDRLSISGLRYDSASLSGKSITIERPRGKILRDKGSILAAMGIRVELMSLADAMTKDRNTGPYIPLPNIPLAISFDELVINNSSIQFTDLRGNAPVELTLASTLKISPVSLGANALPMNVSVSAEVKDSLSSANVAGIVELANDHARVSLDVD